MQIVGFLMRRLICNINKGHTRKKFLLYFYKLNTLFINYNNNITHDAFYYKLIPIYSDKYMQDRCISVPTLKFLTII